MSDSASEEPMEGRDNLPGRVGVVVFGGGAAVVVAVVVVVVVIVVVVVVVVIVVVVAVVVVTANKPNVCSKHANIVELATGRDPT